MMFIRITVECWNSELKVWSARQVLVINVTLIGSLSQNEGMNFFEIGQDCYRIEEEAMSILMSAIEKHGLM